MPEITQIKQQKSKNRVNVYLDGKFGFGIDLDNFVKLGLRVEQELSEEEIAEIIKKVEFQKTLDKILRFGTLRPRSEKEFRDWLRKKKIHESLHKELFNRLKKLELLDDEKFAGWWVEQRINFKPKSRRELQNELRIKGISREIIEEVLEKLNINEEKIAREILEKKNYRWDNLEPRKVKQKKSEFLARRGFSWNVIEKIVNKR